MADIYVRSTDGDNADDGSTWALAKADLTGAAAIDSNGDTIWVSDAHAESTASSISFSWATGTILAYTRILCGDDAAEPPTSLATTGTVTTTGTSNITIQGSGSYVYVYGLSFHCGTGAGSPILTLSAASGLAVYEDCNFIINATGSSSEIDIRTLNGVTVLKNCGFRFGAAGQGIEIADEVYIYGGSILSGGTSPTNFIRTADNNTTLRMEGFDFSNASSGLQIANQGTTENLKVQLVNCKMPSSWTGTLNGQTSDHGTEFSLYNSDSTDTNYRLIVENQIGDIEHETTLVKDSGASDGTTQISWKMTGNTAPLWNHQTLESPEIVKWNGIVGSAITVTVDILHDSVTNLQDDEIWLEVQYLGTSGFPLSLFIDDAAADYLATPADQATSSATWTTTGMTNPNEQQLSVTFTPQEKGFIHAKVHLALASKTVYVDPELQVS